MGTRVAELRCWRPLSNILLHCREWNGSTIELGELAVLSTCVYYKQVASEQERGRKHTWVQVAKIIDWEWESFTDSCTIGGMHVSWLVRSSTSTSSSDHSHNG